ncbi:hypothetical protein BGZ60DRAFT_542103 [Tricladium varicosporioides]|nr:hypothetical protein BGZ60DRAFT_542103 [Hymenoscyphus varicosporioides]
MDPNCGSFLLSDDLNEKRYNNLSVLRLIPLNAAEIPNLRLLMHYLAILINLPSEEEPKDMEGVTTSSTSGGGEDVCSVLEEDENDAEIEEGAEETSEGSEYTPSASKAKKGKKESKEKKKNSEKNLPTEFSVASPSLLTSHLRSLSAAHNAVTERIMSAVHLNGTAYTLLRDAVKRFVAAREGTDNDVLAAVRDLEEVGEENVLCRPWANIPAYTRAAEKFYGVEGEEENVQMTGIEREKASPLGPRLERARLESIAREASASPSTASSGIEKVKRRRRRNPHGIKKGEGRACIPCRERHVTCDRGRPVCGTCTKHKRECVKRPEKDIKKASSGKGMEEEKDEGDSPAVASAILPEASVWTAVN